MMPVLRRLNPDRNHKANFSDAARLWKRHRALETPEDILAAAKAEAEIDAEHIQKGRTVSIEISRERSLSHE
jgi:prolyl oligopeptidase PreP (S9A serine peptidase family)